MANHKVIQYVAEHAFCAECLFKDWESFLDVLYEEGGHVSAILWWDHCRKAEQYASSGSGGYTDPDDPEYMYAETQLFTEGLENRTLDEIKAYIDQQRAAGLRYGNQYVSHDLVPSFYLDG